MERRTVHGTLAPDKADIQARFRALGWSQNELARRIKKTPGMLSRWLHDEFPSSVIKKRVEQVLGRAEAGRRRRADRKAVVA